MEANTIDKKTMELNDAYKKIINLTYKLQQVKILAFLLYLKQHHSLILVSDKDRFLHFNKTTGTYINNEFEDLQQSIIHEIHESGNDSYAIEVALLLEELVLDVSDSLFLLDKVNAGLGYKGVFSAPHELSLIISNFIDNEAHKIYDPFGGNMDFATTMTTDNRHFVANENDCTIRDIAMLRLAIAGVLNQTQLSYDLFEGWNKEEFDAIITLPPFGGKISTNRGGEPKILEDAETVAFQLFMESTSKTNQLITVVPMSFLDRVFTRELRDRITQNNWLDFIICLPQQLFSTTNISMAIVVLRKQRAQDEPIHFFDASGYKINNNLHNVVAPDVIKQYNGNNHLKISPYEILRFATSWNAQWYIDRHNQVFKAGYQVVECRDVLMQVEPHRRFTDITGRVVNVSSLATDVFKYEKSAEMFPESDNLQGTSKITEPVLLLSLIGKPKPTYCQASEQTPIFIKPDVCAYRLIIGDIHIGYLCMELAKRLVAYKGSVIPRISTTQIMYTRIEIPSANGRLSVVEQKNLFEEVSLTVGLGEEIKERLELLLEKKKKEYIEEIKHRKHDMKTPMSSLRNTLTLLESLVPQVAGEPGKKLERYVQRQKNAMNTLSEIVSHIADEEVFAEPEPIDLDEVLSSFKTKTEKYTIEYYPDKAILDDAEITKPMVMMGKSDLLRLVQNIVENAIKRGFIGNDPKYALTIGLTIKEGFYVIDFCNNGNPLPEGMDKERYGMKGEKSVDSDGTGSGGFIVKSIAEHYGGDYDVFSESSTGLWLTHIIVKLPIYQGDE